MISTPRNPSPNGHYHHLDVINRVRKSGSIPQFIEDYKIDNGIMYSCVKNNVPFVLTGSIRDDGPLPGGDRGWLTRDRRRCGEMVKKSTTVICLATHAAHHCHRQYDAFLPVLEDGTVRPVFLYTVDADEFVVNSFWTGAVWRPPPS